MIPYYVVKFNKKSAIVLNNAYKSIYFIKAKKPSNIILSDFFFIDTSLNCYDFYSAKKKNICYTLNANHDPLEIHVVIVL